MRKRNLMKQAGARLTKPKLIAGFAQWRGDWEHAERARAGLSAEQQLAAARAELEAELAEARSRFPQALRMISV